MTTDEVSEEMHRIIMLLRSTTDSVTREILLDRIRLLEQIIDGRRLLRTRVPGESHLSLLSDAAHAAMARRPLRWSEWQARRQQHYSRDTLR
jgi:hypothetical protein